MVNEVLPDEYDAAIRVMDSLRFWVPYSMSRVCVFAIMQQKIDALKIKYPLVSFELRILDSLKKVVATYIDVFDMAFDEFVLNAIKYSGTKKMLLGAYEQWGELVVYARDFGKGIAAERIESIVRGDTEAKDISVGSGTGLPSIKAAVESVGGELWIESRESQGSVFSFSLPLLREPGWIKKIAMKLLFKQPFIIVACGLMGSHRKAVALSLSAFFGCRYINAGFLMESAVYLLWKEMESKALNPDTQEEAAKGIKELLPRIDYSGEPVRIDGVDTSEIIQEKGHSLRKEIRVTINNRRDEFYAVTGYPQVKQAVESYLQKIVKKTIASGKYAGVVIRATEPYSWKEAITLMFMAPLEVRAKNARRSREDMAAWDVVTGNEDCGPSRFPWAHIYEIPVEKLNHRQAYLIARETIVKESKRLAVFKKRDCFATGGPGNDDSRDSSSPLDTMQDSEAKEMFRQSMSSDGVKNMLKFWPVIFTLSVLVFGANPLVCAALLSIPAMLIAQMAAIQKMEALIKAPPVWFDRAFRAIHMHPEIRRRFAAHTPSLNEDLPDYGKTFHRLSQYWDSEGGETLSRFVRGLSLMLHPKGTAIVWNMEYEAVMDRLRSNRELDARQGKENTYFIRRKEQKAGSCVAENESHKNILEYIERLRAYSGRVVYHGTFLGLVRTRIKEADGLFGKSRYMHVTGQFEQAIYWASLESRSDSVYTSVGADFDASTASLREMEEYMDKEETPAPDRFEPVIFAFMAEPFFKMFDREIGADLRSSVKITIKGRLPFNLLIAESKKYLAKRLKLTKPFEWMDEEWKQIIKAQSSSCASEPALPAALINKAIEKQSFLPEDILSQYAAKENIPQSIVFKPEVYEDNKFRIVYTAKPGDFEAITAIPAREEHSGILAIGGCVTTSRLKKSSAKNPGGCWLRLWSWLNARI